jgi:hypothetical protein
MRKDARPGPARPPALARAAPVAAEGTRHDQPRWRGPREVPAARIMHQCLSPADVEPLHDLAGRLHAAGCDTDTTGTAWLDPSRFPDRNTTGPPPDNPSPAASTQPTGKQLHHAQRAKKPAHAPADSRALRLELVNAKWTLWRRISWLIDIQVRITNTRTG